MTQVAEAEALILARMPRLPSRECSLGEAAGAVLRSDVESERDQPPFHRVTMDGIAIRHSDWKRGLRRFRVAGTQGAGAPPLRVEGSGHCVRIMTGAMLPEGADTVIPVERLAQEGETAVVESAARVTAGQHIHPRGSDRVAGAVILTSGRVVGPPEMAVLASAGRARVRVTAPPRVAVVSTGDELVDVGVAIEPYQIRSSNDRAMEASLLRHCGARVTRAALRDDPGKILRALTELHENNDMLILSGGVSMGEYDFVPGALEELGVELVFHRIEQRPGRPMWFGVSGAGKPVFALPGNPVSTLVCLTRYVLPALRQAMGQAPVPPETARLAGEVRGPGNLVYFLPVSLRFDDAATVLAEPRPTNTSGDFISLAGTDGFVELPRGCEVHPEGTVARLYRW